MFGVASEIFGSLTPRSAPPVTVTGANDGLSTTVVGSDVFARIGQPGGAAGDPAKLLEDRYIPVNGHRVFFALGSWPIYNGTVGTDGKELDIFNDLSTDDTFIGMFNGNNNALVRVPLGFYILDPGLGGSNGFQFNYATRQWETDPNNPTNIQASGSLGMGVTTLSPAGGVYAMLATDAFFVWSGLNNTSNIEIDINPAIVINKLFIIRNISSAGIANVIILKAPTAVIWTLGATVPFATTSIAESRCHMYFCDGTTIYQLSTS